MSKRRDSRSESSPAEPTNHAGPLPPAPVAAPSDDARSVMIEVPIAEESSIYPMTSITLRRPHAQILSRVARELHREGFRLDSGRLVEDVPTAIAWICERLAAGAAQST